MTQKKKPGRKPAPPAKRVGPEFVGKTPHAMAVQEATINAMTAAHGAERDLLNQLLGQAQMASAFAQLSVTVTTSKLAYVKETKLYQALKGKQTADGQHFSGTWDEFCSLLGRSREQIDQDILNLRSFGEQALESLSRAGCGYRELRQLRALPEDGKTALLEVAKKGDKEALLELAEDLIAKQVSEKKKLADERDKAVNQYEARQTVIENNKKQIAELQEKLARIPREKPDEKGKAMILEVGSFAIGATTEMRQLTKGAQMLLEHAVEHEIDSADYKRAIEHHTANLVAEIADFMSLCELAGMKSIPEKLRIALGERE